MRCGVCGASDRGDCDCSLPRSAAIQIRMTSTAFKDRDIPDAHMRSELARCLRSLADSVQQSAALPGDDPARDFIQVRDVHGMIVGELTMHEGEPLTLPVHQPSIENIASFIALMQGGGGLINKQPTYIAEKFGRLLGDEPQNLDGLRSLQLREWRDRWGG